MYNNTITINTGLNDFVLIDTISDIGVEHIRGCTHFVRTPPYLGIESLAQMGAYHVRFLTSFERHAFLMKINRCTVSGQDLLDGMCRLHGTFTSKSNAAFAYNLSAEIEQTVVIEGEFLFGTVEYNVSLKKEVLQNHYRKVFSCLRNDTKTGCCSNGRPVCTEIPPK
jgi:hypothetical protein